MIFIYNVIWMRGILYHLVVSRQEQTFHVSWLMTFYTTWWCPGRSKYFMSRDLWHFIPLGGVQAGANISCLVTCDILYHLVVSRQEQIFHVSWLLTFYTTWWCPGRSKHFMSRDLWHFTYTGWCPGRSKQFMSRNLWHFTYTGWCPARSYLGASRE